MIYPHHPSRYIEHEANIFQVAPSRGYAEPVKGIGACCVSKIEISFIILESNLKNFNVYIYIYISKRLTSQYQKNG